ncbi:protein DpdE [Actinokineospora pegani]|uniref:protein DpdE n=1 Tax=Actinokineospora pegani TaxID=2654637 RepID=UPI0022A729B1|nr:protein DpdE [Actinokineospora pegani]
MDSLGTAGRRTSGWATRLVGHQFAVDSELGWGRLHPNGGKISFFESPASAEVALETADRELEASFLPAQERVWWFEGDRWMVGRVNIRHSKSAGGHEEQYYVDFPNERTELLPAAELRVRWSLPLSRPLEMLKEGTVETRFFHSNRTRFLHGVTNQHSASYGLKGLMSSAVEIHEHQIGAARRVLSDPVPRYLLADEVGLGKTIEAGMVLRQFLLDSPGDALVVTPQSVAGQWESELVSKFRVDQFPGRVKVVAHGEIDRQPHGKRLLTIVDEAHRLTDNVDYEGDGEREQRFQALRDIAHSSHALLLLSATPVRSNEDGFLGLLHLLDPLNYPLSEKASFHRRVEIRDDLAEVMSALSSGLSLRYLVEPLEEVVHLLPNDATVLRTAEAARLHITAGDSRGAEVEVSRLRAHLSETYRLHRRMIRSRRDSVAKNGFPARGRQLAAGQSPLVDVDPRRARLLELLDEARLELELSGLREAGRVLQVLVGRFQAPVRSLSDLVAALRLESGHDLSADEAEAARVLRETDWGEQWAARLGDVLSNPAEQDRIKAAVEWVRPRVVRRKTAIACTHPNTALAAADLLVREFGSHRVTALLEGQSKAERKSLVAAAECSSEKTIIVMDRSVEEGVNLQFIDDVVHLDLPTSVSRLEQRLGRFDRWSQLNSPVTSHLFAEPPGPLRDHLGAWGTLVSEVFKVFETSTATLQYVIADMEANFFTTAVAEGLARARVTVGDNAALEGQRKRIVGQDLLDSIEDRADDAAFVDRIVKIDSLSREIERESTRYVHDMLGFAVRQDESELRFSVNPKHPPLLSERTVDRLDKKIFDRAYTSDRIDAGTGKGLLRVGEPFVDVFADLASRDDRGRVFAVEMRFQSQNPDARPTAAFCFDFKIGPANVAAPAGDTDIARAVRARTARLLPTTIERVWWSLAGFECTPEQVGQLEGPRWKNLGSEPERFRELTAPMGWRAACDKALDAAAGAIRVRADVGGRIETARKRAAQERTRDEAILNARPISEQVGGYDSVVANAVDEALAVPQFALESCGAVLITWAPAR